jgi:hypothetical protein
MVNNNSTNNMDTTTWRITHIYASMKALPYLSADPLLSKHLFRLERAPDLKYLPEEGIIGVDLDSFDFDGQLLEARIQTALLSEHVVDTRKVGKLCYKKESRVHLIDMPSKNQLRYIQHIARNCPHTLVYYRHEILAGTNELEYAWMFDGESKKQQLYVISDHSKPLKVDIKPNTPSQKVHVVNGKKSILQRALKMIGVHHSGRCLLMKSRTPNLKAVAVAI